MKEKERGRREEKGQRGRREEGKERGRETREEVGQRREEG